jgi:hypothetical protein
MSAQAIAMAMAPSGPVTSCKQRVDKEVWR